MCGELQNAVKKLDATSDFNDEVSQHAVKIQKETSKSVMAIEEQYKKQKELDKRMKQAGMVGKRSLIKNFILRNNLLGQQQGKAEFDGEDIDIDIKNLDDPEQHNNNSHI